MGTVSSSLREEILSSQESGDPGAVPDHPGELVHMDLKKLCRIPEGGGWRA
ncbi:hypothetical protein GMA12_18095, partial [Kocuria sediminis]|nr:hypothetical protein [Kocuria sediminis]